ncbi:MAG: D-Ala-D-Ala carboxypeptidase family metallohydrolase [Nitrospinaceae bacterium]
MGNLTKNFSRHEFQCHCGCGEGIVRMELVEKLQRVRDHIGAPVIINSAYRCETHNREVGGSPTSSHLRSWAVDIRCDGSSHRYLLLEHLIDEGFRRIGVAWNFIHADMDPDKPACLIWLYPVKPVHNLEEIKS